MSMPNVMISDLLEPHAYATPLQFCSRASIRPQFSSAAVNPQQENHLRSQPEPPLPSLVSNWHQTGLRTSIWESFLPSSLRALDRSFSTPLPFPVLPYYHFLGTSYFFQVRFHYRISCRPRITLFSDGKHRCLRKDGLPLATQHDPMTKKLPTGTPPKQPLSHTERRGSRRCKITQLMRIRPSDPSKDRFEDMRGSVSVSRSGIFFQSSERGYEVGMRLFVTMPYSQDPASIAREYLAEVVRRDVLPTGMFGIGIKILMEMGVQHSYNFGAANSR